MSIMGGPIMRLFIYVAIASLTSLMNDFSKYQTLDEITQITWIMTHIVKIMIGTIALSIIILLSKGPENGFGGGSPV